MTAQQQASGGGKIIAAVAFLTGLALIGRTVGGAAAVAAGSIRRTAGLAKATVRSGNEKPRVEFTGTEAERFTAAMRHYGIDRSQLFFLTVESAVNCWLCIVLLGCGLALGALSLHHYPPESIFTAPLRFLPVPIMAVLAFKHAYCNWLYRRERLGTAAEFCKSRDIPPRMSAV